MSWIHILSQACAYSTDFQLVCCEWSSGKPLLLELLGDMSPHQHMVLLVNYENAEGGPWQFYHFLWVS